MRIIRGFMLVISVLLLLAATTLGAYYMILELTILNPSVGASILGQAEPGKYLVEEHYDEVLEEAIERVKEVYIDPQTTAYGLKDLSADRIRDLIETHIDRQLMEETLDKFIIDSYLYVMADEATMPVVRLDFLINGISKAVPDLVDDYLRDYHLPQTDYVASFLEGGHKLGVINDFSVDWLLNFIMASDMDMGDMSEDSLEVFLEANRENFKDGIFDSEVLTATYIEGLIEQEFQLDSFGGNLNLDNIEAYGLEAVSRLKEFRHLRQEVHPQVRKAAIAIYSALLLAVLILSIRVDLFGRLIGIVWILVGSVGVVSGLWNRLNLTYPGWFMNLVQADMGDAYKLLETPSFQSALIILSDRLLMVYASLTLAGISLFFIGRLVRKTRVNPATGQRERSTWQMNLASVLLTVIVYYGLYVYLVDLYSPITSL